ncbi:MAG: endonuclease [Tissierellia bacterium]|nr:endonuclease [Tissierellia bacterium]
MKYIKKTIKILGLILLILFLIFLLILGFLWISEYRPNEVEDLPVYSQTDKALAKNSNLKVMTWNIGYAGLDKDTDFFMDGGQMVFPIDKDHVGIALNSILDQIEKENSDFNLIQEIDEDSKRTFGMNQVEFFSNALSGDSTFAYNYKVNFVPFPFPPLGKINSGIFTQSKYDIKSASRYQQPIPHKFPIRLANLKRAFMPAYIPIEDTDKKLILINVHLDAYESGNGGRLAQSKQIIDFARNLYRQGHYVLIGGDFNQELREGIKTEENQFWNPSTFPFSILEDDFEIIYADNASTSRVNNAPYIKGKNPEHIIDGFIVSKNIKVNKIEVKDLSFKDSDHNPVVMEFNLLD